MAGPTEAITTTSSSETIETTFLSIESETFTDGYFNPGFKNRLVSNINVNLDSEYKIQLFESWLYGNNTVGNVSMTIEWLIYDISNDNTVITFDDSSVSIITYYDDLLRVFDNNNTGIYSIDSYYVIYSDATTSSKYSGISICNVFDDSYFKQGNIYQFTNSIKFRWNDESGNVEYSTHKSESFTMTANTKASNGSCTVTPEYGGTALVDLFNLTCNGWETNSVDGRLEYNFIIETTNSLVNAFYSNQSWTTTT